MASPKEKLDDICLDINIRRFANRYFDRTASWFYHKFEERDVNGNGKKETFTDEEMALLKLSLYDLAERIKKAADNL